MHVFLLRIKKVSSHHTISGNLRLLYVKYFKSKMLLFSCHCEIFEVQMLEI